MSQGNFARPRLANLLDDFSLGGVSRGLGIFDSPPVRAVVNPTVAAIHRDCIIAPRLNADLLVTHFPPNWRRLALLATLRLRNPRARLVHVEHSYTAGWEAVNVLDRGRFRLMLRYAIGLFDEIVCMSHAQAAWLAEASGIDRVRVNVIYPYSDNPGLADLPLPDFSTGRPWRIGAYGRLGEHKGFDRLIAAMRAGQMPNAELIIGGFGPYEAHLKALAGGRSNIRFVGKVNRVADFLAQCDIVAVPSRFEAYGQVANEAREAGRPILVAPVDGLPEQVGSAGLVVDFAHGPAIASAFASLGPARLTAMAVAARADTKECGPRRQQQWADLLQRVIAKRTCGARLPVASGWARHRAGFPTRSA